MNKAVILLSGGLDSYVSLDIAKKYYDISLALTFDYGQEAFEDEKIASEKMALKYNLEHKIIKLPFLSEIKGDSVWVPNRNGLFLNIAGSFCDAKNYDAIIIGANKEEAKEFPDNSLEFINNTNKTFAYSTKNGTKAVAPLILMDKEEIISYAIKNNLDFSLIKSCYDSKNNSGKRHCGVCPSCLKLKNAILKLKREDLLSILDFEI